MEDEIVDLAIAIAEGMAPDDPEFLDYERVDEVATYLATRTSTRFVQEQDTEEGEDDERLLRYITNAIASAYVVGALDAHNTTQPNIETLSVSGKSGTTVNIYIS